MEHIDDRRRRPRQRRTPREYFSDKVAGVVGSWKFVIFQVTFCMIWMLVNLVLEKPWDPFPFSTLTNMLGIQGALAASFILIVNNRQAELDSRRLAHMQKEMDRVVEEVEEKI